MRAEIGLGAARGRQSINGAAGIGNEGVRVLAGLRRDHAGLQPTLGHGIEARRFAGYELAIEIENAAIATLALGALNGKRGTEEAAGRFVCRGRNDELAHGDRRLGDQIHGELRA